MESPPAWGLPPVIGTPFVELTIACLCLDRAADDDSGFGLVFALWVVMAAALGVDAFVELFT